MYLSSEHFASRFHSLEGNTVGQKRKELSTLLKMAPIEPEQQDNLIRLLKPTTHLEHLFKIEVLSHLRRFDELCEIIKSESRLAFTVLKYDWIFSELIRQISPLRLVQEVFPSLSLIIRLKLVNRIIVCTNDCNYFDELFDILESEYGFGVASDLIPCCSSMKLQYIFVNFNPRLKESTQLKLARRNPNSLRTYYLHQIETGLNKESTFSSVQLLKYLVTNHADLFWLIFDNFKISAHLGQKTTRRVIESGKDHVIKKANEAMYNLNLRVLIDCLGDDFYFFCLNLFPKRFDSLIPYGEYRSHYFYILSYFRKMRHFELLANAFRDARQCELIDDDEEFINEDLLSVIKDEKVRGKYATAKLNANRNEWIWLKYLPREEAVQSLKDRINLTANVVTRRNMLCSLVKVCKLNNDRVLLLDICKYFNERHLNSAYTTRSVFLYQIDHDFDIIKLDEKYWHYFKIWIALNRTVEKLVWSDCGSFLKKQLHRCLLQDRPASEIKLLFKDCLQENPSFVRGMDEMFLDIKSEQVDFLMEAVVETCEGNDKKLSNLDCQILYNLCMRNARKCYRHKLPIPDRLLKLLKSPLDIDKTADCYILHYLIRHEMSEDICQLYWKNHENYCNRDIYVQFLKYRPEQILNNFKTFADSSHLRHINKQQIIGLCRQYESLKIPQMLVSACKNVLDDNDVKHKAEAIKLLSHFVSADMFSNTIERFYPQDTKIDITDEDDRLYFIQQCSVVMSLHNVQPSMEALNILMLYLKADYLKPALISLSNLLLHMPLYKLQPYLDGLNLKSKPLSMLKIVMSIYCHTNSRKHVLSFLAEICNIAEHASLCKHLFQTTLRYFKRNPYNDVWSLLKECILKIDKRDVESFKTAVEIAQIPFAYRPTYIEFVWHMLKSNEKACADLKDYKFNLLNNMKSNLLKLLSPSFCLDIIKSEMFNNDNENSHAIMEKFTAKCIFHLDDTIATADLLQVIIFNLKKCKAHSRLSFVRKFCFYALKGKARSGVLLDAFVELWSKNFDRTCTLREHILLQFTKTYCNCDDTQLPSVFVHIFDSCAEKYTLAILDLFIDELYGLLGALSKIVAKNSDRSKSEFVYGFIKNLSMVEHSLRCQLLVVKLILKDDVVNRYKFNDILKKMHENCQHAVVRIYLSEFDYQKKFDCRFLSS